LWFSQPEAGTSAEQARGHRDYDEARLKVEELAANEGWRYVHSANEPHLIAGVGTYALEMFEAVPDLDYLFVPIGGGSGAAGCCLVRSAVSPGTKVIGVQASGADAFTRSWRGPERVTGDRVNTFAEGMATRVTFDLTFAILKEMLDDIVVLDEPELEEGVRAALRYTHNLAEGSGAAPLAATCMAGKPRRLRQSSSISFVRCRTHTGCPRHSTVALVPGGTSLRSNCTPR
jgi:threonine dehydratase